MSKYISKTKSKIIFREIAEKEIENLKGDQMGNKVIADIMRRREALRARQAARNAHAASRVAPQPKLDEFEKEYEAFIAEQRRLKEEREAKEAAEKETKIPVITFIEKDDPVNEVKDDVISEEDTTSENSEEVQVVETKPKKKSKKKKVVEATETVE
jgi:hypothetical protein